jgi:tRNA-modifying protein YgfZ
MQEHRMSIDLADFGALRLRGPDATRFLQGQLSSDVARLSPERSLLAGYHNPQGRVIAVLRLVQIAPDDLLAILPRELAPVVASRLSKFVLRSKVKIADQSAEWRVSGLVQGDAGAQASPAAVNAQERDGESVIVCVGDKPHRWLRITAAHNAAASGGADEAVARGERDSWRRLDIAAGVPHVYAVTTEEFVAQMLNLDVLGAITFDKGCYTGQEVIARAHYRGRVKRRTQRFVSRGTLQLKPGDSAQLSDGRTAKVVEAVQLADGRCEFLAVASFSRVAAESGVAAESPGAAEPRNDDAIDVEQLDLPYSLPE